MLRIRLICLLALLCVPVFSWAQGSDWAGEYSRLSQRIEQRWSEPKGSPKQLPPYLQWMEQKAADRDEVDGLLQEINAASMEHPEDRQLSGWVQKFFELRQRAQSSGDRTVNDAAGIFLRWGHGSRNDQWPSVISELNDKGRILYRKANETGFSTQEVTERARCMVRFATMDIETGGLAIWYGRQAFLGWTDSQGYQHMPSGDFDVDCSRRADQTVTTEGDPGFPVDQAYEKTKLIRDEAQWWKFQPEKDDVIDLETDYYKDALCLQPPHGDKMGHDWFRDIAEENELDDAVDHNEGFYGTLYGNVQARLPDGDQPADGAKVSVTSGGETWSSTADSDGNYEIRDIILHAECAPHDITAEYEKDQVKETYDGPLEEPDDGARHRKDLLIIPSTVYAWTGSLTVGSNKELHCNDQKSEEKGASRSISMHDVRSQRAEIQIYGKDVVETATGFAVQGGKGIHVTGTMRGHVNNSREQRSRSKSGDTEIVERSSMNGSAVADISDKNLSLQVVRSSAMGSASSMQSLVQQFQQGKISAEKFQQQMVEMTQPGDRTSFDVTVSIQINAVQHGQALLTDYRCVYDRGESEIERDDATTKTMPIVMPFSVTMKGKYTKGKNGRASVTASVQNFETAASGKVWDCPDYFTNTTGTLNLRRTKVDQ